MAMNRIKYGSEGEADYNGLLLYQPQDAEQCPDCGAEQGEVHTKGCDIEQCPECERQLISCEHGDELL